MPFDLVWRPQAKEDMIEIYYTIAFDSLRAADRLYDRLTAKIEMLRDYPQLGVRRPEIAPGARILIEAPYIVLYQTDADTEDAGTVEVVRIIDGRRDLPNTL